MKLRSCILSIALLMTGYALSRPTRVTQHDPYPLFTTAYPYEYLSTNERRKAKDMPPIYGNEVFRFSVSALRSTADFSTTQFREKNQPLFNRTGPWNVLGLFYNQTPVENNGNGRLKLTPFQAYLAQTLNISTQSQTIENNNDEDEAEAFQYVINPANHDSEQEFGFIDVPGEYRKHGIRTEIEALFGCGFGARISTGVSDICVLPCIKQIVPNPTQDTSGLQNNTLDVRREERCDLLKLSCDAKGRQCNFDDGGTSDTFPINKFTKARKEVVLNKIIDKFEKLAEAVGYDVSGYNEADIDDIDVQLYWRQPVHINEDRARWPYVICTPFLVGHATIPAADRVSPQERFALAHGNNGFTAYGLSGGFSLDFVDMAQIAFDAGMTRFEEEHRTNLPVPTTSLQQGILPRFADADIKPGTNWTFGAALYGYYMYDRLSFHIEYRLVHHTEDEVRFTQARTLTDEQLQTIDRSNVVIIGEDGTGQPSNQPLQDTFSLRDIDKDTFVERSKWESHFVHSGFNYDISPNISLGFLWQAPVHRRNAFKQTSLLWSMCVTF